MNFFGGPGDTCVKASAKLRQIEQDNEDAMLVFLSDVWLDQVKVSAQGQIVKLMFQDHMYHWHLFVPVDQVLFAKIMLTT